MKKRRVLFAALGLIAALLLLLVFVPKVPFSGSGAPKEAPEQSSALGAHELLMEHIATLFGGYPDYFGGDYVQDSVLHIQVTDLSGSGAKKIRNLLKGYEACIVLEEVEYSYNDLFDLGESAAEEINAAFSSYVVTSYGVDVKRNVCLITLASEDVLNTMLENGTLPSLAGAGGREVIQYEVAGPLLLD